MARSYRGQEVNMEALAKKNEETVALGRSKLNARGDKLGRGGKIVKTKEERLAEYYEANKTSEFVVSPKNNDKELEKELTQNIQPVEPLEIKKDEPIEIPVEEKPIRTKRTIRPVEEEQE